MEIVFSDYADKPTDIHTRMQVYKKCGVKSISLPWFDMYFPNGINRFKAHDIAKLHGIKVEVVHMDKRETSLLWSDGKGGEKVVKRTLDHIKELASRCVKVGVFHLTNTMPPPVSDIGLKRINEIVKYCEKVKFILAVENVEMCGTAHLDAVLESIKSPSLKICFDIGHAHCFSKDVMGTFDKYKSWIICTHLHNNHGNEDSHFSFGNGNIDFAKFFEAAKDSNIKYNIIEVSPPECVNTEEKFEKFVKQELSHYKANGDLKVAFLPSSFSM